MSEPKRYSSQVWDRLFQMLYACDETTSDAEIDADLQRAGIDVRPTLQSIQQRIEQAKAREKLAQAPLIRNSMIDQLRNVVAPHVADLRSGIRELIERAFPTSAQVAHYQKLEKASSDDELRTLMDDLTKLAAMREQRNENERKAE